MRKKRVKKLFIIGDLNLRNVNWETNSSTNNVEQLFLEEFFPGPLAFCKKAVERVSSEKNILNSSVECVEWSGVEWSGVEWNGVEWFFLEKVICMHIIRSGSMS